MRKMLWTFLGAAAAVGAWYWSNPALLFANQNQKPAVRMPAEPGNLLKYAPNAPQLAYLKTEQVATRPVPLLEPLQGHVTYDEEVTTRITSPIAGRVVRMHAQIGDRVKAGQALLAVDSPDYAQAIADARHAESDLHLKQLSYERAHTLYNGEVLAKKDFESAATDLQQSQIELSRATARLSNIGSPDDHGFVLRTRMSGIVMDKQVNLGSEIRPDNPTPIFTISDPRKLWVNVELAEKDLGKIHLGQRLEIIADAYPGDTFIGKLELIGKVVDPSTRRIVARVAVPNPQEKLKPEMYVRAIPLEGDTSLPEIPNNAIVAEGLKSFVFVEKGPGLIEKRQVELAYRGHEKSYASSGLSAGERVVVSGALLLNAEFTGS